MKTTETISTLKVEKGDEKPSSFMQKTPTAMVEKIGNVTPVQDFEAMLSRRDDADWVLKAIKGMKNKIYDLVEDSFEGDKYDEAVECLFALRKGCILEQVCLCAYFAKAN